MRPVRSLLLAPACMLLAAAALPAAALAADPVVVSPTTASGPTDGGQTAVLTVSDEIGDAVGIYQPRAVYFAKNKATVLQTSITSSDGPAWTVQYTVLVPAGVAAGPVDVTLDAPAVNDRAADNYTYVGQETAAALTPTETQCGDYFKVDAGTGSPVIRVGTSELTSVTNGTTTTVAQPQPPLRNGRDWPVSNATSELGILRDGCFTAYATRGSAQLPNVISDVSPRRVPAAGGAPITVSFTGPDRPTGLWFGAFPAQDAVIAPVQVNCIQAPCPEAGTRWTITATSPPGGLGRIKLRVTTDTATSYGATALGGTYEGVAAPTVTGWATRTGPLAGGTEVSVSIAGDPLGEATVTVGGKPATGIKLVPSRQDPYGTSFGEQLLLMTVPPSATAGPAEIVVRGRSAAAPSRTYELNVGNYVYNDTPPTTNPCPVITGPGGGVDAAPIVFPYSAEGTATLKTLTTGSLPLRGALKLWVCLPQLNAIGDLTFEPAQGKLTSLGFLPVTARVVLTQAERVTGTLFRSKLDLTAKVRIKLPSVKTLGVELAGGANCQAKQISSINLKNTQEEFLPTEGGPIAGTFSISDLTGCGFLTNLVSPLTKGSGNAIALNLGT